MIVRDEVMKIIGGMPADASLGEIFLALRAQELGSVALEYQDNELTPDEWLQIVANSWAENLNDPREDIYTLDDGVPVNEPG